ncbi:MAG: cysteine synthase A [Clostridia bacterium]|nr:cysteine synthase A [Clostridia bacterium]
MRIHDHITDLTGATPLLRLTNYTAAHALPATLLAKLEGLNPGGSAKDRVAVSLIADAVRQGQLAPGGTIIEPTSGNTGIGLAMAAAALGYRCIIVMPDSASVERRQLLQAYGAQVVLTPGSEGMQGCIHQAEALKQAHENSFIPGQFDNPANPAAHYATTGPEIWQDTEGTVDVFVAGIGTGGTITGVARYLKEQNPAVRIVGVEPADSPLLTKGFAAPHPLQGIGANFIPDVLDLSLVDEIIPVTGEDAFRTGCELARKEGVLCGITSGAAVWAAHQLALRPEYAGKTIVALLPDSGERYLSTAMFRD